jgi:hypothetical protein
MVVDTHDGQDLKAQLHNRPLTWSPPARQSAGLSAQGIYFVRQRRLPENRLHVSRPGKPVSQYGKRSDLLLSRCHGKLWKLSIRQFDQDTGPGGNPFPRPALSDDAGNKRMPFAGPMWPNPPSVRSAWPCFRFWNTFNLRPDATCGHSYGELPALYAAGWIDRETLLALSVTRGRLMADAGKNGDAGSMLAVKAHRLTAWRQWPNKFPTWCWQTSTALTRACFPGRPKPSHRQRRDVQKRDTGPSACRSPPPFTARWWKGPESHFCRLSARPTFTPTGIPVYANVTATPYPADPSQGADLLGRQLTSPVRFQEPITHLYETGVRTFIEVGPQNGALRTGSIDPQGQRCHGHRP